MKKKREESKAPEWLHAKYGGMDRMCALRTARILFIFIPPIIRIISTLILQSGPFEFLMIGAISVRFFM